MADPRPAVAPPSLSGADPARAAAALAAVAHRALGVGSVDIDVGDGARTFAVDEVTTFAELVEAAGCAPTAAAVPLVRLVGGRVALDGAGPEVAGAWAEAAVAALAHAAAQPDVTVATLRLLDGPSRQRMLADHGHGGPAEHGASIPNLVHQRVRERPGAPAVSEGGRSLDYAGLWERSGSVAAALQACGVAAGQTVGVLCAPSIDIVVALLAILRCGAAYLAVDAAEPAARVQKMLALAAVQVVLTDDTAAGRVPAGTHQLDLGAALAGGSGDVVDVPAGPEHVAYVSFTSGSTGEPKGVAVPHRGVVRLLRSGGWASFGAGDVFLQVAPVAFDASTIEIWGALLNGGRVAVHAARPLDLGELSTTIVRERVTVLLLTTGLFHSMMTEHPEAFAGARHVMTGGDVLSPAHLRRLFEVRPGTEFTNGYGPTENTSYTTCWTTTEPPTGDRVPIGRAIGGTRVLLLDDALEPVPPGVIGQLYASGLGLAHGYVGAAGLTAERFVPSPVDGGARMYRTGDRARWLPDGNLDFVGRSDRQVKIRGLRVEPADVEEEVRRLDEIREAVVVAQRDAEGRHRLICYAVAADPDAGPSDVAAAVRARLGERLAAPLVPTLVLRESLPLTPNGKIDRSALPAATRSPRPVDTPFAGARTSLERRLAELWGDVLGVEPVGVHDTFFDLGGYSLLAAALLQRVREELDVDLPARYLYRYPTVAQFAAQLPGSSGSGVAHVD